MKLCEVSKSFCNFQRFSKVKRERSNPKIKITWKLSKLSKSQNLFSFVENPKVQTHLNFAKVVVRPKFFFKSEKFLKGQHTFKIWNVALLKFRIFGRQQLCRKFVALCFAVMLAPIGTIELVVWPGLLASGFLEYARCIPSGCCGWYW